MDQLKDLQTIQVANSAHIDLACHLSFYYNYIPIYPRELNKLINRDWWTGAELLTDLVRIGRYNYDERMAVAFVLLNEFNFKRGEDPTSDLQVTVFAMDQAYDLETATAWADFRIYKAQESLKRVQNIYWPVDERDTPLLLRLTDLGWKSHEYSQEAEKVIMRK